MTPALELRGITFAYDGTDTNIFEGLDFELNYGEFALLSGLSGEGKSTMLSLLNGVIPYLTHGDIKGEIYCDGEDIAEKKISERAVKIGTVLQNADDQIVYDITRDEIAFGCENFRLSAEEIDERIVKSTGLMKLDPDSRTRLLSGGQKQRLVTASTLAMEQKIILLDEPLANLDITGAEILLKTLRGLADQGYAVLLVEHRLDMVLPYVDTVYWIQDKKLVSSKKKEDLVNNIKIIPAEESSPNETGEVIISGRKLVFKPADRAIINELDIDVRRGERIVLLGENGCGKTTLMRALARLTPVTSGEMTQTVVPDDKKRKASSKWFAKVGYVYQNPACQLFMPTLTEEVGYKAVSPEKAQEMIDQLGLSGMEERHPQSLSEGQKRRSGIACICAEEPEVLFLDEPTVGQDYDNLKSIVDVVNKLNREKGTTVVTVTHDVRCAAALADRVLIMRDGKIAETGTSELATSYLLEQMKTN